VKSSADEVADVPELVVTVMSTVPTKWAGATAVMEPSVFTVKLVAARPPQRTDPAPVKLLPEMVTDVPPMYDPDEGLTPVTTGAGGAV